MRNLLITLTLASLACPQDAAWTVKKPVSKPEGDAVEIHTARGADKNHKSTQKFTITMTTPIGVKRTETTISIEVAIKDGKRFEAPFTFEKCSQNGMDFTAEATEMFPAPKLMGRLTEDGRVAKGSLTDEGLGNTGKSVWYCAHWAFSFGGKRSARKGEAWELSAEEFAPKLTSAPGHTVKGNVYQVLEAVEEKGGARCARLKTTFGLKIIGARTPWGEVDMVLRGSATDWQGLDGFLRERDLDVTSKVTARGYVFETTMKIHVEGGPSEAKKAGAGGR